MRYRALDANDDYVFGQGSTEFLVDTPDAVGQAVKTRLRLFQGEWFLDSTEGTPWGTQILGEGTTGTYDIAIREVILGTPNVVSIDEYVSVLDPATRSLSVVASITTAFGQILIQTVI